MLQQRLRKVGNSYVVTIPKREVERRGLKEGQLVAIDVQPLEVLHVLPPDLQPAFDESWRQHEDAYRSLAR